MERVDRHFSLTARRVRRWLRRVSGEPPASIIYAFFRDSFIILSVLCIYYTHSAFVRLFLNRGKFLFSATLCDCYKCYWCVIIVSGSSLRSCGASNI